MRTKKSLDPSQQSAEESDADAAGPPPRPLVNLIGHVRKVAIVDAQDPKNSEPVPPQSPRKVSERWIAQETVRLSANAGVPNGGVSPSHLTRALHGKRDLDNGMVGLVARAAARGLKLSGSDVADALSQQLSADALIAVMALWRTGLDPVPPPPSNNEVRAPIVRTKDFREVVKEILYGSRRLITIHASDDLRLGRSAFATSICQYAAYDCAASVRRTLRVVSLAQLADNPGQAVDSDTVSRWIAASLSLPRRSVFNRYEAIVESLRNTVRPLLLFKDIHKIPLDSVKACIKDLLRYAEDLPDFKIVIVSEAALNIEKVTEADYLLAPIVIRELVSFFRWRSNLDLTDEQSMDLEKLFGQFDKSQHRASLAGLFAGLYTLSVRDDSDPWAWFLRETKDPVKELRIAIAEGLKPEWSEADYPKLGFEDLYPLLLKKLNKGKNGEEIEALIRLAIFPGSFTKNAARACIVPADDSRANPNGEFELLLDRLCMCGAVIFERPEMPDASETSMSFIIPTELRHWIYKGKNAAFKSPVGSFDQLRTETETRYLTFVRREIQRALTIFDQDPHAIDPASARTLSCLLSEISNIDYFLNRIWNTDPEQPLPIADMDNSLQPLPGLSFRDQQCVLIGLLVADLAPLWEAHALFSSSLFHLRKGYDLLTGVLERAVNLPGDTANQIRAIRGQTKLSEALILVRQRDAKFDMEFIANCLEIGKEDCEKSGYTYGKIFGMLTEGTIANRRDGGEAGVATIRTAVRQASELATYYKNNRRQDEKLLLMRDRLALSRALTFGCQRELARAQLRAGDIPASLESTTSLLQAAIATRESRLIAEALLAQANGLWCRSALDESCSFSEEKLAQIRDLLFQADVFVTRSASDRESLRGLYLCSLGLYMVQRSLLMQQEKKGDYLEDRQDHGLALFRSGFSLIADVHYRGVLAVFMADSYLRSLIATVPAESLRADFVRTPGTDDLTQLSFATSYLVRGLDNLCQETQSRVQLSSVMKQLIQRFYNYVGTERIEAAIRVYYLSKVRPEHGENTGETAEESIRKLLLFLHQSLGRIE